MPTIEGWPTPDEERTMKHIARQRKEGMVIPEETIDKLTMSVTLTIGDWKKMLAGGPPEKLNSLLWEYLQGLGVSK